MNYWVNKELGEGSNDVGFTIHRKTGITFAWQIGLEHF